MRFESFEGKVALVTGAASGIGAATAALFEQEGATVVRLDVQEGEGVVRCDVSDRAQVRAAVADAVEAHGGLDVVANVAGLVRFGRFEDITPETWQLQLDVNLSGPFHVSQEALPSLVGRKGCIVNVASIAGVKGQAYQVAYGASKAGLIMLTKGMAVELASQGVRVNCVCPGTVLTPLTIGVGQTLPADVDPVLMARLNGVLPGLIDAREVAESIAYLASDAARSITGTSLVLDLGVVA